jgi:hypothetical protein
MRRTVALLALLVAGHAFAFDRHTHRVQADELTAMPAAAVKRPVRAQRDVRFAVHATPAWAKFRVLAGGTWSAAWDRATAVPNRIWGSGIAAPGANASPAIAEAFARQLLADHIDLLAPGARASDFVLVSNVSDNGMRTIGFVQYAGGLRVVGGQVSFRFKADRMFVIGSEALPYVKVDRTRARLATTALAARAADKLRSAVELPGATLTAPGDDVILPLVGDDAVLGYRIAAPMRIDGGAQGAYLAYVDPASGEVLAVRQQNLYATGQLLYKGVDRNPLRPRVDRAANSAKVAVGGLAQTTSPAGMLSWSPDGQVTVTTSVVGQYVTIVNKDAADAPLTTADLSLSPNGTTTWDASADEKQDAQVNVFISTNRVKDFVRANLDPALPGIDDSITANVNIAQACNAFFDGTAINFFHKTMQCENTGLVEDVVFHEYGHAVHVAEIIEGVGSFDGAMSEGAADFLAASMTGDSGMGRGFFHNDAPLRELDPANGEWSWPKDISEIHQTGLIFGGVFWDLRKALLAAKPEAEALALTLKLYRGTLRRSVNIPSSMIEALAEDDDDGNLDNGTPNECFIRDAYGRHGLRTASGIISAPGSLASSANAVVVRVDLTGLSPRCTGDEISKVTLVWKSDHSDMLEGSQPMTRVDDERYWGELKLTPDDVTRYQTLIEFTDGSHMTLPDNLGDPFYSIYSGITVPLYCTNFDTDPFTEGWTSGTSDDSESLWKWGVPSGRSTDPANAFTGTNILALNLDGDYHPTNTTFVKLPEIDVGHYSDVRLQYRRWLAVEDAHFDQSPVLVNLRPVWVNFDSAMGDSSSIHHIDKEWRFHDVPLSGKTFGTKLTVSFDVTSDEGLELGGWQLDDLCIVANVNSICGDGIKSPTEACDEGTENTNLPNRCRTYCGLPACGDAIVDDGEECDDGIDGSNDCTETCMSKTGGELSGCCSTGRGPGSAIALALLVGLFLFRPRRSAR